MNMQSQGRAAYQRWLPRTAAGPASLKNRSKTSLECRDEGITTFKANQRIPMKPHKRKVSPGKRKLSRRKFMLTSGAAATAFAIVPRHVLGGPGFVAPSEKITVAHIGCGTQGLREMVAMLAMPQIQFVAVCDPVT